MGYFSNGDEAAMYEERYCYNCANYADGACAVLTAHMVHNYDECNKPDSILNILIPRSKDGLGNDECNMFRKMEASQ